MCEKWDYHRLKADRAFKHGLKLILDWGGHLRSRPFPAFRSIFLLLVLTRQHLLGLRKLFGDEGKLFLQLRFAHLD